MGQAHNEALAGDTRRPDSAEVSDEQVVERVRGGDTAAFELLMRRHNQRLYRTVRSIVRDEAETEDILQESYMRAYSHLDQFRGQARFATWLTRIAVHEALHRREHRGRVTAIDDVAGALASPGAGPEDGAADRELRHLLEASIDRLSDDFRTVFVLRDVEGLSTAETADSLDIPEETVKTRLHRARRQLQGHLNRAMGASAREVFTFGFHRCDRLVAAVMQRVGDGVHDEAAAADENAAYWSSDDLTRSLVRESPDAIVVADTRGVIRVWNAAAERVFGYAAGEAIGQSLDLIVPEKQRERHWAGYDAVMRSGTTRYGADLLKVPAVHRDGRRLSIEFRVALMRDDAGRLMGVAAFLRDATQAFAERKQLLERLATLEGAAKKS